MLASLQGVFYRHLVTEGDSFVPLIMVLPMLELDLVTLPWMCNVQEWLQGFAGDVFTPGLMWEK